MPEKKELKVVSNKDNVKFNAVVQITAAILMNDEIREELSMRGVFSNLNETIVSEAIEIVELIEQNI